VERDLELHVIDLLISTQEKSNNSLFQSLKTLNSPLTITAPKDTPKAAPMAFVPIANGVGEKRSSYIIGKKLRAE